METSSQSKSFLSKSKHQKKGKKKKRGFNISLRKTGNKSKWNHYFVNRGSPSDNLVNSIEEGINEKVDSKEEKVKVIPPEPDPDEEGGFISWKEEVPVIKDPLYCNLATVEVPD